MRTRVVVLLLAGVMLASCGTRLPDSEFSQATTQVTSKSASPESGDALDVGGDVASEVAPSSGDDASAGNTPSAVANEASTGDPSTRAKVGATDEGPNRASDVGITETTITLGNITAENGVLGDAFAPAVRGVRAWAAATNAAGGIHGRKIILKTCDDREDRNRDLSCAQQLIERDKVFALVGTNSRAFGGAAQYLADHEVPVLGFPITNSYYRYPTFFSVYRNGYPRDGKHAGVNGNLVYSTGIFRWFAQNLNINKAAVFEYDIDESKQAGQAFAKALKLEGFEVTEYTVSFAAPSFDQGVAQMQRDGTQIIFDTMDDGANRKLCDAMERRKFSVKAKVSTIVAMGDSVGNNYNDTCRNVVFIPSSTRNYQQTAVPEIAKFRDAYKKYQPGLPVHQWALEGWLLAQLTRKYVDSAAPTRKGFVKFLNGLTAMTATESTSASTGASATRQPAGSRTASRSHAGSTPPAAGPTRRPSSRSVTPTPNNSPPRRWSKATSAAPKRQNASGGQEARGVGHVLQFAGFADPFDLALGQHVAEVGELHRVGEVLLDQHDGAALVTQRSDAIHELFDDDRRQAHRQFVEHQHLRVTGEGAARRRASAARRPTGVRPPGPCGRRARGTRWSPRDRSPPSCRRRARRCGGRWRGCRAR